MYSGDGDGLVCIPAGGVYTKTIEYRYDPLYRLTNAIYSTGLSKALASSYRPVRVRSFLLVRCYTHYQRYDNERTGNTETRVLCNSLGSFVSGWRYNSAGLLARGV
ncbi:MAG: hypothetical protein JXA78_18395 [Anaerolineales bacterium]|nr:hypothetical protein [Anaerolineales bacterium]